MDRWQQYDQLSKEEDTWRQKVMQPLFLAPCTCTEHDSMLFQLVIQSLVFGIYQMTPAPATVQAQAPIAGVIQLNEQDLQEMETPPATNFGKNGLQ